MRAAVVTAFKQPLEVKQVEIPKPGVNDVLVKLIACGVCHTDLHAANGGSRERLPLLAVIHRFVAFA